MNFETPSEQTSSLSHAADTQALVCPRIIRIEPLSPIGHGDKNLICTPNQFDFSLDSSAVLSQVLKRLLNDSEQTKSHVGVDNTWNILSREIDLNPMPISELLA
jgi:hypothetical protein